MTPELPPPAGDYAMPIIPPHDDDDAARWNEALDCVNASEGTGLGKALDEACETWRPPPKVVDSEMW